MKILSIANEKGGVGKTVLSANLAWELSDRGYLVLALDLDQQRDLTKILYREAEPASADIFGILCGNYTPAEACVNVKDNLYLIPGSRNIKYFNFQKSEDLLRKILAHEDLEYVDIVIIDHPPSTSEATLLGYVAATEVLMITDTEKFSTENIGDLLDDLQHIKQTMNPDLNVLGIVANRVDMRRTLTKIVLREMRTVFGLTLFNTFLSNNVVVPASIRQGKTVWEIKWRTPFPKQLEQLTDEIEERMGIAHGNG